jgi:hypothetical protein
MKISLRMLTHLLPRDWFSNHRRRPRFMAIGAARSEGAASAARSCRFRCVANLPRRPRRKRRLMDFFELAVSNCETALEAVITETWIAWFEPSDSSPQAFLEHGESN